MDNNRILLNRENTIEVYYEGDQTYDSVMEVVKEVNVLSSKLKKQGVPVLILNSLEGLRAITLGSRRAAFEGLITMEYDKIALYKTTRFLKYVANIIIKASGKGNKVKYFDTKEIAEQWLKKRL